MGGIAGVGRSKGNGVRSAVTYGGYGVNLN